MRLLIDVGNTSLKAVLWQDGQIQPCDTNNIPWLKITVVVYACVGRSELLKQLLEKAQAQNIDCFEATVSHELGTLHCAYPESVTATSNSNGLEYSSSVSGCGLSSRKRVSIW